METQYARDAKHWPSTGVAGAGNAEIADNAGDAEYNSLGFLNVFQNKPSNKDDITSLEIPEI